MVGSAGTLSGPATPAQSSAGTRDFSITFPGSPTARQGALGPPGRQQEHTRRTTHLVVREPEAQARVPVARTPGAVHATAVLAVPHDATALAWAGELPRMLDGICKKGDGVNTCVDATWSLAQLGTLPRGVLPRLLTAVVETREAAGKDVEWS